MSADGCLLDAALILTKEEYDTKILFDGEGLLEQLVYDDFALAYELLLDEEDDNVMTFTFGDLLTHVPLPIRAEWQPYYLGMKADGFPFKHNCLDKLLFFDFKTMYESDTAMRSWQERLDAYDK
jgi:hypothetical protein